MCFRILDPDFLRHVAYLHDVSPIKSLCVDAAWGTARFVRCDWVNGKSAEWQEHLRPWAPTDLRL